MECGASNGQADRRFAPVHEVRSNNHGRAFQGEPNMDHLTPRRILWTAPLVLIVTLGTWYYVFGSPDAKAPAVELLGENGPRNRTISGEPNSPRPRADRRPEVPETHAMMERPVRPRAERDDAPRPRARTERGNSRKNVPKTPAA